MLDLSSTRWKAYLTDNFGSGDSLQALLQTFNVGDSALSEDFQQRVCHQGSISTASIAAVPHLIQAAEKCKNLKMRQDLLILVGLVCDSF